MLIKVPVAFIQDHQERDLPTPMIYRGNFIDTLDPAFSELVSDTRYYAEDGNDAPATIRLAARRLWIKIGQYV